MLGLLAKFGVGLYLASTALFVVRIFAPPGCTHHMCIEPAFNSRDLERADLFLFVSDDPRLNTKAKHGKPPAALAARAARVLREHTNTNATSPNGTTQLQVQLPPSPGADLNLRLALVRRNVTLSDGAAAKKWDGTIRVPLPPSARGANGSVWAHAFLVPASRPLDPDAYPLEHDLVRRPPPRAEPLPNEPRPVAAPPRPRGFDESVLYASVPLVTYRPVTRSTATMLLQAQPQPQPQPPKEGRAVAAAQAETPPSVDTWVSHWRFAYHPLRFRLVAPLGNFPTSRLAPDKLAVQLFQTADGFYHRPYFFVEDWTVMGRQMLPLAQNTSRADPVVAVHLTRISLGRFRIFKQLELAFEMLEASGAVSADDLDEIKRYLTDEYLWRFALMQAISLAHAVLSFMAFKNDVGFWKGRESVAGLSSRSVIFNAFASVVVFLYLSDYSSSYMLLATTAGTAVIDLWKVTRVLKLSFSLRHGVRRGNMSRDERRTAFLDATAMDMLALALGPLVVGFAAYSLVHIPHRSWYSWAVESLANGIYVFGFVFMTPQLFINYKLKSVAHMPWRVMAFKFFNTTIDDVFSFLVSMPVTHRIACFRDDFVFCIFLYQRWLYRVDKKRANEYGIAYDDDKPAVRDTNASGSRDASEVEQALAAAGGSGEAEPGDGHEKNEWASAGN